MTFYEWCLIALKTDGGIEVSTIDDVNLEMERLESERRKMMLSEKPDIMEITNRTMLLDILESVGKEMERCKKFK